MAEIKKYLDTTALGTLVDQIKAEDGKTLAAAKKYTDDSVALCDEAGAAATAEGNAKAYTDLLANGAVKTNTEAIATLNGTGTGSVAKAVADAKTLIDADIDAVEAIANKNKEDIAAINDSNNGILVQAKTFTTTQTGGIRLDLADLTEYVGAIPEASEATDIVGYIQEKTAGIATDTALEELTGRVSKNETDIAGLVADHLVAADKTELEGKIAEAAGAAGAAQGTADAAKAAIDAFLKEADATEKAVDTLKEIQAELAEGEASAASMLAEINALKEIDNATQAELDAALVTVNGEIGKKADKTTVEGIEGRVANLEAIDVATKGYVDQAETDAVNAAKSYTDGIDTALKARLDALESTDHEHANKAELDLIASGDKAKWDAAEAKAHEHGNKGVIDGITAEKVAAWDAAEGNAKTYTDNVAKGVEEIIDGIDARVAQNTADIATKADAGEFAIVGAAVSANTAAIAANTSAINSFTAITPDEVNALFA